MKIFISFVADQEMWISVCRLQDIQFGLWPEIQYKGKAVQADVRKRILTKIF